MYRWVFLAEAGGWYFDNFENADLRLQSLGIDSIDQVYISNVGTAHFFPG